MAWKVSEYKHAGSYGKRSSYRLSKNISFEVGRVIIRTERSTARTKIRRTNALQSSNPRNPPSLPTTGSTKHCTANATASEAAGSAEGNTTPLLSSLLQTYKPETYNSTHQAIPATTSLLTPARPSPSILTSNQAICWQSSGSTRTSTTSSCRTMSTPRATRNGFTSESPTLQKMQR